MNLMRSLLALGDGALVWEEGFLLGILNFSVGHYFYISSVRTDKLLGDNLVFSLSLGLVLYGASAAIYLHFLKVRLKLMLKMPHLTRALGWLGRSRPRCWRPSLHPLAHNNRLEVRGGGTLDHVCRGRLLHGQRLHHRYQHVLRSGPSSSGKTNSLNSDIKMF